MPELTSFVDVGLTSITRNLEKLAACTSSDQLSTSASLSPYTVIFGSIASYVLSLFHPRVSFSLRVTSTLSTPKAMMDHNERMRAARELQASYKSGSDRGGGRGNRPSRPYGNGPVSVGPRPVYNSPASRLNNGITRPMVSSARGAPLVPKQLLKPTAPSKGFDCRLQDWLKPSEPAALKKQTTVEPATVAPVVEKTLAPSSSPSLPVLATASPGTMPSSAASVTVKTDADNVNFKSAAKNSAIANSGIANSAIANSGAANSGIANSGATNSGAAVSLATAANSSGPGTRLAKSIFAGNSAQTIASQAAIPNGVVSGGGLGNSISSGPNGSDSLIDVSQDQPVEMKLVTPSMEPEPPYGSLLWALKQLEVGSLPDPEATLQVAEGIDQCSAEPVPMTQAPSVAPAEDLRKTQNVLEEFGSSRCKCEKRSRPILGLGASRFNPDAGQEYDERQKFAINVILHEHPSLDCPILKKVMAEHPLWFGAVPATVPLDDFEVIKWSETEQAKQQAKKKKTGRGIEDSYWRD
ncbi:hypothetical protein CTRI78_v004789 [Colletotrichum trifolii]|uniref:Uncharacterized protein n=1 Tax=Colletotrichum trifolii TaxID=5466 RepID=A0A4R8RSX1_COLTR|nr:hypothetical protein CTRI78_v004789 [Colletotrichum trifolii]